MDTTTKKDTDISTLLGKPCNLILFNDDHHDMLEVSLQIMKAIKCSSNKAASIMLEAHTNGKAVAFTGSREVCELKESILAEIQLRTEIEQA